MEKKVLTYFMRIKEHKQSFWKIFIKDREIAWKVVKTYQEKGYEIERFVLERLDEPLEHYEKCRKEHLKRAES
jgi:hypothetical protein